MASGGYDYDFVEDVPDRLICNICTKPLCDAHLTVCCGQHYCKSCLEQWFKKCGKQQCPHCRAEGKKFQHVVNREKRSEIIQLKIRCTNKGKGCEWVGELGHLESHLNSSRGCDYVLVACPNKCSILSKRSWFVFYSPVQKYKRKDLAYHLQHDCELRAYQCTHCGLKKSYKAITDHYPKCPEFPLGCPNKCGEKDIKRKDMANHCSKCPQEVVQCPFEEAGCKSKVVRCEFDHHLATSQQQHLLMVMSDYKKTKEELQKTKQELAETKAELQKKNVI